MSFICLPQKREGGQKGRKPVMPLTRAKWDAGAKYLLIYLFITLHLPGIGDLTGLASNTKSTEYKRCTRQGDVNSKNKH